MPAVAIAGKHLRRCSRAWTSRTPGVSAGRSRTTACPAAPLERVQTVLDSHQSQAHTARPGLEKTNVKRLYRNETRSMRPFGGAADLRSNLDCGYVVRAQGEAASIGGESL